MEELLCGFSNAVHYKNSFPVLKFSNQKFRVFFYFFPQKRFSKPPKWACSLSLWRPISKETLEMINDRMRHRTGAKHQAVGTFCVAFFPEAGSSLIVFCAVTPTCGWKRRSRAGPAAPGRASGRSQAPPHGRPLPRRAVPPGPAAGGLPERCRAHLQVIHACQARLHRSRGTRVPPAGTARPPPVAAATSARRPPPIGWADGRGRGLGQTGVAIGWNVPGRGEGRAEPGAPRSGSRRNGPEGDAGISAEPCEKCGLFNNEAKSICPARGLS